MEAVHKNLIAKANAAVAAAQSAVSDDPLRPKYHFTAPAHWMNDPNGPVYYKGAYHLFYQHNPYGPDWGNMSWGHAISKDLVHWNHLPIALTPTPDSVDKDGVFSGACVIRDNVPTIIYTGVQPEVQCIAHSYDDMTTWIKYEGNPVISIPPRKDLTGFRDPFVWREGDHWYMLIGSGIKDVGGAGLLYKSGDLIRWTYLHLFCTGFGKIWECPLFFSLGDKYILIVSPESTVQYSIGEYIDHKFYPESWQALDLGGSDAFYAPNVLPDSNSRCILWGWIKGGGRPGYPWNGLLTLPRILSISSTGSLMQAPAPELKTLRESAYRFRDFKLSPTAEYLLPDIRSDCWEIKIKLHLSQTNKFGIRWGCIDDPNDGLMIIYDSTHKKLIISPLAKSYSLPDLKSQIVFHIFFDQSVYEIFINYRICITGRYYPKKIQNPRLALNLFGPAVLIQSLKFWELKSIN